MTESPISIRNRLNALVFPEGKESLSRMIETNTVGHFESDSIEKFRGLLDINSVSENLSKGMYPNDRFKIYMQGSRLPPESYSSEDGLLKLEPEKTNRIFSGSASFVIDSFDEIDGEVERLTHFIELELGVRCWANFYFTKGEGGALHRHYDDHDVLAMHLTGKKRWHLGGKTTALPLGPFTEADEPPDEYQVQKDLEEGDLLFVPRGEWHWTENLTPISMHLSLALRGITGVELMKHVARNAKGEEKFRTYLTSWGDEKDLEASLNRFKDELFDYVQTDSLDKIIQTINIRRTRGLRNRKKADKTHINEESILRIGIRRKVKPSVLRHHLFGHDFFGSIEKDRLVDAIVGNLYDYFELSVSEMKILLEENYIEKIELQTLLELIEVLHNSGMIYISKSLD